MKMNSLKFHIGFWVIYIGIYTILGATYKNEFVEALVKELLNLPMRLIVAYFNYFILLPRFLLRNKVAKYFTLTISTVVIAGFFQRIINYYAYTLLFPDMPDFGLWLPYKFLQAAIVLASPLIFLIGIIVIWKLAELQKKTKDLENEKLQSELKYLKSQINPHFLFNTLNNIYGLSLENSKKVPALILKLSDFLSFSLYESSQQFITLEKELQLMNDFIGLEKSRFDDRVKVTISVPEKVESISIPPLILVSFVENAFKHSLKDETELSNIDIHLETDSKTLQFMVKNSKPNGVISKNQKNGLGLSNIQKRLDIIYGKDFFLDIKDETHLYTVLLKINFNETALHYRG